MSLILDPLFGSVFLLIFLEFCKKEIFCNFITFSLECKENLGFDAFKYYLSNSIGSKIYKLIIITFFAMKDHIFMNIYISDKMSYILDNIMNFHSLDILFNGLIY